MATSPPNEDPGEPVLTLTRELVGRPSVTPEDAGCQALLAGRLEASGFRCRHMPFHEVSNLWAVHGRTGPLLVFAGHTDVVPTGPESAWASAPFEPVVRDGHLYGRGTADMKGSLAAMTVAAERFTAAYPDHPGRLAFLITSDEEGPSVNGTRAVVECLVGEGWGFDYCLVGEPSSSAALGDTVRIGRRGSLNGELTVHGVQGHIAYPDLADNPIHRAAPALAELATTRWDEGNSHFPPTTWQASNIAAGTGAGNVIPGTLTVLFNFRFSTEQTAEILQERVEAILRRHGLRFDLTWSLSGQPFLTPGGRLVNAVVRTIRDATGAEPALSTSGGTSDGRFIAPVGCEVVELGPCNDTIHKVDERVGLDELPALARLYQALMEHMLLGGPSPESP